MTIQETHILVLQELQKINSYANRNFEPEEIDLFLNKYTRELVDKTVGRLLPNLPTNFEHNQRVLDLIRTLVVTGLPLTTYKDGFQSNLVYGYLPNNYKHLVSDASEVVTHKGKKAIKTTEDVKIYLYPLLDINDEVLYKNLTIKIGEKVVFSLDEPVEDIDTKYQLITVIQEQLGAQFETVYGEFVEKGILFLPLVSEFDITVEINSVPELPSTPTPLVPTVWTRKAYIHLDGDEYGISPNRLHSNTNLRFVMTNPYEKQSAKSPLSTISGGKLFVYEDDNYKVKRIFIDYVKRPVEVSLHRNVHSDLTQEAQDIVIQDTVLHIKGIISDPAWQIGAQEKQLNNN